MFDLLVCARSAEAAEASLKLQYSAACSETSAVQAKLQAANEQVLSLQAKLADADTQLQDTRSKLEMKQAELQAAAVEADANTNRCDRLAVLFV